MEPTNEQPDWKMVAAQLRCPEGEAGVETGKRMEESNTGMIHATIDTMNVQAGEHILEIGFGNGKHLEYLFGKAAAVAYTGMDMSQVMIDETTKNNPERMNSGSVSLVLTDGQSIPSASDSFDRIFTVNTVYFWEDPVAYAREILRVLKPGGTFYVAFGEKDFMKNLPFTAFGFTLYHEQDVIQLLSAAGFDTTPSQTRNETIRSNNGETMERTYHIVIGRKQS